MQDPEVDFTALLKEPFVVACPVGHPLARRRSGQWDALAKHSYALVSHASRNRVLIDQALAGVAHFPRPVCEVRHVSTLIGLVQSGLAIAVVPQLTLPTTPGSVVGVRLENPEITRTIGLIQRRGRSLSPAASAFSELLTQASHARATKAGRR